MTTNCKHQPQRLACAIVALALSLLCNLEVLAHPVTQEMALRQAREFMSRGPMKKVRGDRQPVLSFTLDRCSGEGEEARPMLYVFGLGEADGYVIVAGDDGAHAILGYGTQGSARYEDMPCNMQVWLNGYADEIAWAVSEGYRASGHAVMRTDSEKADVPFLIPTFWDQKTPFHNDCFFEGEYSYTGCAATTMAQIMYYWAKVGANGTTLRAGAKAMARYTSTSMQYEVPALPAIEEFDWDNMILGQRYDEMESPWTTASEAAVAQLMRYCGQSLHMDYSPTGSGAFTSQIMGAFCHYFSFDKGTRRLMRNDMTAETWAETIYAELAAGRPVAMSGYDEEEKIGHEFICDGYDASTGLYHFNWGWSGYCDGFFDLEALEPGGTGSGGTLDDRGTYNSRRDIIVGIQPPIGQVEEPVAAEDATFLPSKDLGTCKSYGADEVTKNGVTISVWPYGILGNKSYYYVYEGSTISVAASSGVITKVVFTCTAKNTKQYGPGCFGSPSLGTYTYDGYTGTWEGRASEFFITAEDLVRMTKVEVFVEDEPQISLKGDANDDGYINMLDVTSVINYVLGNVPTPFVFFNADSNDDGLINMSDVTGIINLIIGKETND